MHWYLFQADNLKQTLKTYIENKKRTSFFGFLVLMDIFKNRLIDNEEMYSFRPFN